VYQTLEDVAMQKDEKIRLLEEVLVSYIARYGFTPEARRYFINSYQSELRTSLDQSHASTKH